MYKNTARVTEENPKEPSMRPVGVGNPRISRDTALDAYAHTSVLRLNRLKSTANLTWCICLSCWGEGLSVSLSQDYTSSVCLYEWIQVWPVLQFTSNLIEFLQPWPFTLPTVVVLVVVVVVVVLHHSHLDFMNPITSKSINVRRTVLPYVFVPIKPCINSTSTPLSLVKTFNSTG